MKRTSRTAQRRAAHHSRMALGGGVLALALAGCGFMSPITATQPYTPSDGVGLELAGGQVALRNMLVVGSAKGQPGAVVGAVVNRGAEPVTVILTVDLAETTQPSDTRVDVPARGRVLIAPGQRIQMPVPALPVAPGDVMTLTARTAASGTEETKVPVLPPEGPYASLTVAPTPSPSVTATGDPGEPGTGSQGGPFPTEGASGTPSLPNSEEEPAATPTPEPTES